MDNVGIESVIQKETSSEIRPLGSSVLLASRVLLFLHTSPQRKRSKCVSDFNFFLAFNIFTASNSILFSETDVSSTFAFSVQQVTLSSIQSCLSIFFPRYCLWIFSLLVWYYQMLSKTMQSNTSHQVVPLSEISEI